MDPGQFPGFSDVMVLSVGTRSTLYRATEGGTHRAVALKVLGTEGPTAAALEAFAREAAVLAALGDHPHIVELYRTFALPTGPVLVLQLCHGSLAARLRRGRVSVREAVSIGVRVAGALETLHAAGVLHRAVSPASILLSDFGEPVLTDFAVARLQDGADPGDELLDEPGPHTAPELMLGQPSDVRTDVYGLASTLYELVSGHPPFGELSGAPAAATILRILRDPPPPITGVPLELSDLLLWGMAKEPVDRPPGAAWFADELRRVESGQGWPRTQIVVSEATGTVTAPARGAFGVRRLHLAGDAPSPESPPDEPPDEAEAEPPGRPHSPLTRLPRPRPPSRPRPAPRAAGSADPDRVDTPGDGTDDPTGDVEGSARRPRPA